MTKPKALKNFEKLPIEVKRLIKLKYPHSFRRDLISIVDHKGKKIKVLPFETEEKYYLIRIKESYFYSNDLDLGNVIDTKEIIDLASAEIKENEKKEIELNLNIAV